MGLIVGIPRDHTPGERRVSLVPEVAKRFTDAGAQLLLESGAGALAWIADAVYAGAEVRDEGDQVFAQADLLFCVSPPPTERLSQLKAGAILSGFLQPFADPARIRLLCERKVTSFPLELVPRISRAQSMDALSSQASVAGYQCALIAASHCPKFFPMLTTAAGTIRPSRALIIGAGVAGLQAIATVRRLGASVEAYDVRAAAREQVESLGAKFVDTGVSAEGTGGYARELTDAEKAQQRERLAKAIAQVDVVITTAAVPGKRAPRIVDEEMVGRMRPGSVIVDMAAESGGNCALTRADETVTAGGVTVIGPVHLASRLPVHASEMLSRNFSNFFLPFLKEGQLTLDWNDEVITGTVLTHDGTLRHAGVRKALNWEASA